MEPVKCYLDDYSLIKAYLYKPFNTSIDSIYITNHSKKMGYQIEFSEENNEYKKYNIYLDKRYKDEYNIRVYINNVEVPLIFRHIVSKERYDNHYHQDLKKLGPKYCKDYTSFRVFAPNSDKVRIHLIDTDVYKEMNEIKRGLYEFIIDGDQDLLKYRYEITRYNEKKECIDPFAYSSGPNSAYSVVLNPQKFIKDKIIPSNEFKNDVDAIIYEVSIRDFTSIIITNTKTHSKFLSLVEEGTSFEGEPTGFDYLKTLGITHLQLMPVMDFGSIDELKENQYNWGYDPIQYNVTEGSYSSDLSNPYTRVNDLRIMINKLHKENIRVNLDVVFNHVYQVNNFSLEILMPYYCFRYFDDEHLSNGSFCGNEIRTESYFMREYIKLMITRYLELYDIDGLRFDLMGLMDIRTMNDIDNLCRIYKNNFMLYGEGWNMPTTLSDEEKSILSNAEKIKHIGFFNPYFRDIIKGPSMANDIFKTGFSLGDNTNIQGVKDALMAMIPFNSLISPNQSINYLECHDNFTYFDKAKGCMRFEHFETLKKRSKFALGLLFIAQGVPFVHSGQEFLRTKFGVDNTYNSGDYYNQIDYAMRNQNMDVVNYFKDLIRLRKLYPELRFNNYEDIISKIYFKYENGLLIYNVGNLVIFINNSLLDIKTKIDDKMCLVFNDKLTNEIITHDYTIPSLNIIVFKKILNEFDQIKKIAFEYNENYDTCHEYDKGYYFFKKSDDELTGDDGIIITKDEHTVIHSFITFLIKYQPSKNYKIINIK